MNLRIRCLLPALMASLCACDTQQTVTGVVSYQASAQATSSHPTSDGAASGTTMVVAGFTALESNALMYLVDATLNQAFTAAQYTSAGNAPNSDTNVTSPCSRYFNGQGSAVARGTFNAATGTAGVGNFNLTLDFNQCAVVAADGNTYTLSGSAVTLEGTQTSATDATSGDVVDSFQVTDLHGAITITDATGFAVPCEVQLAGSLSLEWGDNVTLASTYKGLICQLPEQGGFSQVLPVAVP